MNIFRGLKNEPDISAVAEGEAASKKEIGPKRAICRDLTQ